MKMHGLLGVLALCCLLSLPVPVPALANEPPFGEPFEVVTPLAGSLRGPFKLNDNLAAVLAGSTLWRTDATPEGTFELTPPGVGFQRVMPTAGKYHWLVGFEATFPSLGRSLWRTDGTKAGTILLEDDLEVASLSPGYHRQLGLLFFSAAPRQPSAPVNFEPWVSDGTPAGTRLLKELHPGGPSSPLNFRELGSEMAFLAATPESGHRWALWLTDGTAAGTRMIRDPEVESFYRFLVVGSTLFLEARSGIHDLRPGRSLWRSDGTPEGTVRLASFEEAIDLAFSGDLGDGRTAWTFDPWPFENRAGKATLVVTDGTVEGTVELMTPEHFVRLWPFRGAFYFAADDGASGYELWRTDGTPEGTELAFETCPGPCSDLLDLHEIQAGDALLLWMEDPEDGWVLHASDGTAAGTTRLFELCPGPCSATTLGWRELGGLQLFFMGGPQVSVGSNHLWVTDLTQEGTRPITGFPVTPGGGAGLGFDVINGHVLFGTASTVWAMPIAPFDPPAPPGDWVSSPELPGFSFKVRISAGSGSIRGAREPACIPETVCVSGALAGRSEVFLRVVGPRPNGRMWPTLVKFSTSEVEVWVRQESSGEVRYYRLAGARPGFDELPGLFDREGFAPAAGASSALTAFPGLTLAEPSLLAGEPAPPPAGAVFTSEHFPDFRFRARITAGEHVPELRKEAACIEETLCLSGAVPGRSELFVRIVGPRPNGRLWPTIVKLTTSTVEVWIEQLSTGEQKYYRIEGAAPGKDDLTGLFDRQGFAP